MVIVAVHLGLSGWGAKGGPASTLFQFLAQTEHVVQTNSHALDRLAGGRQLLDGPKITLPPAPSSVVVC